MYLWLWVENTARNPSSDSIHFISQIPNGNRFSRSQRNPLYTRHGRPILTFADSRVFYKKKKIIKKKRKMFIRHWHLLYLKCYYFPSPHSCFSLSISFAFLFFFSFSLFPFFSFFFFLFLQVEKAKNFFFA